MQLTEAAGRASVLAENLKPEYAVLVGLCVVSIAHWGENIFNTQAFVMGCFALVALSLMTADVLVGAFGVYSASWLLWLQITRPDALLQYVDSMTWIMAGLAIYTAVRRGQALKPVSYLKVIALLATALSVLGLITYIGKGTAVAMLGNQNFLGAFLAISAIGCYELEKKWRLLLIPILGCLIATKTATAIVAFLVGTGVYFLGNWGLLVSVVPGAWYILFIKGGFGSLLIRYGRWQDAIEKIVNNWNTVVFGVGPGILWKYGDALNSEYVYIAWNLGLLGLALAMLYILRSFKEVNNRTAFAMFITVLVDGISNHLMHTPPTGMLAVFVFAIKDRLRIPHGSQLKKV